VDANLLGAQRQYLYFCTSKLSTVLGARGCKLTRHSRYLYLRTSKESNLIASTGACGRKLTRHSRYLFLRISKASNLSTILPL
jgi:hypothetical protein